MYKNQLAHSLAYDAMLKKVAWVRKKDDGTFPVVNDNEDDDITAASFKEINLEYPRLSVEQRVELLVRLSPRFDTPVVSEHFQ